MRKIEKRSVFCLILAALLGIGLAFFCFRFVADGDDWASYPYNRHLYNNQGVLKGGTIIDSRGVVLSTLSEDGERVYNEDGTIRRATLHAVGDPAGNIGAGALTAFADKLSGYNLLTGAYSPLGTGNSVYLTIDSELNRVAYEALGGQNGTVGIYNYKTGEILCMVSTPTFDPADPPNIAADDPAWDGVYVNRLLSANSIPGSIFKVVTLNAAIENIPDLFQRKWNCTGSVEIGGDTVTCPYAHGEQDIESALANSCNGVFGQLAVELGSATMKKYADAAGLTESLRVDGIQTASGHFDFDVSENQLAWAGVGQGQDTMCPISMLQYMGAIANGGKAAVPRLIEKSTTDYGLPTGIYRTKNSAQLIDEKTAGTIADLMHNNVIETYGQDRFPGMDICAKSGTAEVGADKTPNAWFTGFLRDEDTPYAFIVLVENGGGNARAAAAVLHEHHKGQRMVRVVQKPGEPGMRGCVSHLRGAGLGAQLQLPEVLLPVGHGHVVGHHLLQRLTGGAGEGTAAVARVVPVQRQPCQVCLLIYEVGQRRPAAVGDSAHQRHQIGGTHQILVLAHAGPAQKPLVLRRGKAALGCAQPGYGDAVQQPRLFGVPLQRPAAQLHRQLRVSAVAGLGKGVPQRHVSVGVGAGDGEVPQLVPPVTVERPALPVRQRFDHRRRGHHLEHRAGGERG